MSPQTENEEQRNFKSLLDLYASPIYNFTARLTNKDAAVDITEDTFIKAWKNFKNFDEEKASFKTWIFTIARNTATDFLRKKKSSVFSDLDTEEESFAENIADESLLPDEILEKVQDSEILNDALNKIPINYKTVLTLHYQEEMTFKEISEVLDRPLNTVKSWHQRAILQLREILTP